MICSPHGRPTRSTKLDGRTGQILSGGSAAGGPTSRPAPAPASSLAARRALGRRADDQPVRQRGGSGVGDGQELQRARAAPGRHRSAGHAGDLTQPRPDRPVGQPGQRAGPGRRPRVRRLGGPAEHHRVRRLGHGRVRRRDAVRRPVLSRLPVALDRPAGNSAGCGQRRGRRGPPDVDELERRDRGHPLAGLDRTVADGPAIATDVAPQRFRDLRRPQRSGSVRGGAGPGRREVGPSARPTRSRPSLLRSQAWLSSASSGRGGSGCGPFPSSCGSSRYVGLAMAR